MSAHFEREPALCYREHMRHSSIWLSALLTSALVACGPIEEEEPNTPPTVRLRSPLLAPVGAPVTFDATETSDDSGVALLRVQFGDGGPEQYFAGLVFSYTYYSPATYEVLVQAEDVEGAVGSLWRQLTVVEQYTPPYCDDVLACEAPAVCDEGECFLEGEVGHP